jgi:CheY-like chemotaxis protein
MKLVEELLDVSRISSGKLRVDLRDADIAPVVDAAVLAMRPSAEERDLVIETDLGRAPIWVGLDPDRMQQVFTNLLSNAIKFTPSGGRISLTIRDGSPDTVEVVVKDTGAGISPEFLPLVFDRFRQADSSTRRKQGGLGLGLAVVRDIVERHGGTVRVESPGKDKGASFIVRLPKVTGASRDHGSLHRTGEQKAHADISGLEIVLVEDDYDTREIMSRLLARSGANVTSYASVEEGLDAIGRHPPNVVISDLAMPGRDGYDLIRELRGRTADEGGDLPALALSAHASQVERERALDAGFDRHAAKPIQTADLVAIVAELAARPRAGSSAVSH